MGKKKAKKTGARRTQRTRQRAREKFLDALSDLPNVAAACEAAAICRTTAYEWREDDPDFKEAWNHAEGLAVAKLEEAGLRRARDGVVRRPIFHPKTGKHVGDEIEYSDAIWGKMMAAHHPDYRNRTEVSGPAGKPIEIKNTDGRMADVLDILREVGVIGPEGDSD